MAASKNGKRPPRRPAVAEPEDGSPPPHPPPPTPEAGWPDEIGDSSGGDRSTARTTLALMVALVVLVAVAATESWYLWLRDDTNVVSAERPVVASAVATGSAVDTAAKSMKEIVSTSYKNYNEQVDEATSKMTEAFAEEYRQTTTDIEDELVAAKTEVAVEITGQGVVNASSEQVEALVFLTQLVTKNGKGLTATPYRALVTVVNTDQGWLVSDIETR